MEEFFAVDPRRGKLASNPRMLSMAPGRQDVSTAPRSHGNAAMIPPGCAQHDHRNPAILPSGITRAQVIGFAKGLTYLAGSAAFSAEIAFTDLEPKIAQAIGSIPCHAAI